MLHGQVSTLCNLWNPFSDRRDQSKSTKFNFNRSSTRTKLYCRAQNRYLVSLGIEIFRTTRRVLYIQFAEAGRQVHEKRLMGWGQKKLDFRPPQNSHHFTFRDEFNYRVLGQTQDTHSTNSMSSSWTKKIFAHSFFVLLLPLRLHRLNSTALLRNTNRYVQGTRMTSIGLREGARERRVQPVSLNLNHRLSIHVYACLIRCVQR